MPVSHNQAPSASNTHAPVATLVPSTTNHLQTAVHLLSDSLVKQWVAQRGVQCLQASSTLVFTPPSALSRLRAELLSNEVLNVQSLTAHLWRLRQGWQKLMPSSVPYPFVECSLLAPTLDVQPVKYCVLKPLDVARAHVSDHYQRKYGIHILPAAAPAHGEGWVRYLNRTARLAEGHAVGLVLRGLRNPYYNPRSNYEDHVVPVVLQLDNGWLNLISLDSLGETSPGFTGLGAALKAEGCRVRSAAPVVCRQADEQSCHTDAMQVLKDLLVRHQGSSCRSIWQFLVGEQAIKPESSGHGTQPLALPFWLNKTTQRSKALPPQATAHVDIVAHRKKYAAAFPVRGAGLTGKVVNQFLLLKAVRNAEHLVDTLTGIPGRHERQAWLAALQRRHGLLVQ